MVQPQGANEQAEILLQDGRIYDGQVSQAPNGYEVWSHPDGHRYEGTFAHGKPHGQGRMR